MLIRLQNTIMAVDIAKFAAFRVRDEVLYGLLPNGKWVTMASYPEGKDAIDDLNLLWNMSGLYEQFRSTS